MPVYLYINDIVNIDKEYKLTTLVNVYENQHYIFKSEQHSKTFEYVEHK